METTRLPDRLAALLGPRFADPTPSKVTVHGRQDLHGWVLEDLTFTFPDGETAPAWFLRPPGGHPPVPAVLYAHAHGNTYDLGRDELIHGRGALQGDYARDLADLGIAALCIEMPCFGTRQSPGEDARAKAALWRGDTLFGQMLAEQRAGVDFLNTHPAIDPDRRHRLLDGVHAGLVAGSARPAYSCHLGAVLPCRPWRAGATGRA